MLHASKNIKKYNIFTSCYIFRKIPHKKIKCIHMYIFVCFEKHMLKHKFTQKHTLITSKTLIGYTGLVILDTLYIINPY